MTEAHSPSSPDLHKQASDRANGTHGFTDDGLDFIINYKIKYRMGRDDDGAEEERE